MIREFQTRGCTRDIFTPPTGKGYIASAGLQYPQLDPKQFIRRFRSSYTGLDISTCKMCSTLCRVSYTLMTPTQDPLNLTNQAIGSIYSHHSHNWYDERTTKEKINDSPDKIDDIQESFKKAHPTMECPLKKEDEAVEQSKVANKANGNPVKDVQELSDIKTYDYKTFIQKLLHQVPAARRKISRPSRPIIVW
ncbi:hypothetical protein Tco_0877415 [Tanacetum coccineum]|uniref:Uncharacterized protein n=1 Tax=Tanacetum coccineum TaxID=301880 RepID=A0ABQ5BWT7_9ASTR